MWIELTTRVYTYLWWNWIWTFGSCWKYDYLFIELIFPASYHPSPISICPNLISFLYLFSFYSALHLSDVWRFDLTSQQWALVGGSAVGNLLSSFPTLAIENPSTNNHPGGRKVTGSHAGLGANSSELWIFGGFGYGESSPSGYLNDLWRFKPISNSGTTYKLLRYISFLPSFRFSKNYLLNHIPIYSSLVSCQ